MESLEVLRKELDRIDDQIAALYEQRMDVCGQVGEYKVKTGRKVFDRQREKEKLADVASKVSGDFNKKGIQEVYQQLMSMSRKLQYQQLVEASTTGVSYNAYLFAVSDPQEFGRFVELRHRSGHSPVELSEDGVVIDEKLSELLDVSVGDTITLEGDKRVEVVVSDITENYVNHYIYLTDQMYTQLFGGECKNNVMLLDYRDGVDAEVSNQTSETLMKMDGVASYSYIATIRDSFEDSMDAINYAVVIIIVAAAALAFVVLYNLTNINITERRSELATLKVLGFYDGETTAYVLRENVFLTIFGVILGLVLGRFLHSWMVLTVEVDLVMFGRTAPPYAYVLAAALTALFSLIVNVAAHFRLKKIDMVESLKTVE